MKINTRGIKLLCLFPIIWLSITGCKKEFLDKTPSDRPTNEQIFGSISGLQTAVNGLYGLINHYYGDGTYTPLAVEIMGEDVMVTSANNYNRFVDFYQYNVTVNSPTASDPWQYSYRIIANSNNILANIDAVPASSPGDKDKLLDLKGQVYALRGLSYFNLVRLFGESSASLPTGLNAPGVPISLDHEIDFSKYNLPRSTVGEVYKQILSDLALAKTLVLTSNTYKGYLDVYGIYALSAQVNLAMGNWEMALLDANTVISSGKFSFMSEAGYLSGFNVTNDETIWSQAFVDNNTNGYLSLPSFTYLYGDALVSDGDLNGVIDVNDINADSYINSPSYPEQIGYSSLRVTKNFIDLFSATDYRKKQFAAYRSSIDQSFVEVTPGNPYRQKGEGHISIKYQSASFSSLGTGDFPRIRISELYLIKAEAEYELGSVSEAAITLFSLQNTRDALVTTKSSNSGVALRDEIRDERRKELVFEGHRFYDLKRWDIDLNRSGGSADHWSNFSTLGSGSNGEYIILKNSVSKRFCLPIPQSEINANLSMTIADQNSVYR